MRNFRVICALILLLASVFNVSQAEEVIEVIGNNTTNRFATNNPSEKHSEVEGSLTSGEKFGASYIVDLESYRLAPLNLSDRSVITLEEALHIVTRDSYRARIAQATFDKQAYNIALASSEFKPVLSISSGITSIERGGASTLAASSFVSSTKQTFFNLEISDKFPSGQTFSFSQSLSRAEVSVGGPQAQQIPKSYSGQVGFSITQPLGRGMGKDAVTSSIKQAQENLRLEEFRLTNTERQLRYETYLLYYQLLSQRKALSVREVNFEAALKLLERNYERFKVGLSIRADVLQAENNVLNQKLRLIEARRAYLDGLEQLALLLGIDYPINIEEESEIEAPAFHGDLEDFWERVKENNVNLKDAETQIRLLEIEKVYRESEVRPDLSLSFDLRRQGEEKTASSVLRNLDNQSYSFILNYRLPWKKASAKARLAQVEKDLETAKLNYEQTLQNLRQEWESVLRELKSKSNQLELAKSNVEVAKENYQIQLERNYVGLADTLDVIQAQEALLEAELSLVTAQVEHQSVYRRVLLLIGTI